MPIPTIAAAPRRPLLASAAKVDPKKTPGTAVWRSFLPWQTQALLLYDLVPELHHAGQFYARMLSKVRIFPVLGTDLQSAKVIETGLPVDLLRRIEDPGGGHTQLLFRYGQLQFITGDGYLFGQGVEGDAAGKWSYVWREELKVDTDNKVTHVLGPGLPPEILTLADDNYEEIPVDSAVAYRMWTPHPRLSGMPDSPMRSVLDVGEELLILTKTVHATATSRLTRGVLLMPQELAPPPLEPDGDEDPLNEPLAAEIALHFESQIENPSAASALSPFVLWGAYEYLDRIRMVALHDAQTDYLERDLRAEAITRLGYGLDMPPEALTGFAQANHWTAFQIQDSIWQDHGEPKMRQFCQDLCDVYMRPALEQQGYADWQDVMIDFDATAVTVNPDRSDDANEAWDRGAVGYEGLRAMKNIPEKWAQTPEEHAEWLETKIVKVRDGGPGGQEPTDLPATKTNPSEAPPAGGTDAVTNREAKIASAVGAASLAMHRCRELAGIRLRQARYQRKNPQLFKTLEGMSDALVAVSLGHEAVVALGATDLHDLVRGGADGLRALFAEWGYSEPEISLIAQMIEMHAARTLFQNGLPDLPAGFAAQLERTKGET